ncbi:hypothetical protein [Luteipulveratus mongoliensis]|uniref:WXG100 family type VII secretion target n=1 Tax=Luteipulveratus mongoliensis TaxID=571913 RepID=A0A0K1JN98_9MICO|nr:hypothetical protein [Luteipulveratus mongoliensis]AKU18055.1 hypothetical protein VV02_22965 [Luteipulveratus mongoliensis]
MTSVGADLQTLQDLHSTLKKRAADAPQFKKDIETVVHNAKWDGPNADKFRSAWDTFKPVFDKLHTSLGDAERDVKNQHNDLAASTGSHERI